MRRLLLCLLILCFPASFAAAQDGAGPTELVLQGRVLDAGRGAIAGAQVAVHRNLSDPPVAVTRTDHQGAFSLRVAPGTYALRVTADGFAAATRQVTVDATVAPAMELVLQVAGFSENVSVGATLEGVNRAISSATRTPTPLVDIPQAISVVNSELIADQRLSSMADVVRFMPGVGIAQGEGNRDTPVFRGNATTSDFFVDGVRDDVQYFRDVYNLERVEALKGPNAMIFGRGGAGGVINRVTRQADWRDGRELSVQLGSWNNRRLTGDYDTPLNDTVAVRVTGLYENSDSYRHGVDVERYGVQPSVAFRLGGSTLLRASYEHFHDDRTADRGVPSLAGRPVSTEPDAFFGDPANSRARATVDLFASVLEHRLSDTLILRNRLSYGVYDKFYQNVFTSGLDASATMAAITAYNNATDRDNLFDQAEVVWKPRTGGIRHTVLAGAELGRQQTDNFRATGFFGPTGSTATSILVPVAAPTVSTAVSFRQNATDADNHGIATVAAAYLQDQVDLTPWLQAVGGVRFDAFDLDFTNNRSGQSLASRDRLVSPRLGLVYKPVTPVSIYSSYTIAYLPRSGEQLSSLSLSNQALEPEQFRNYEIGAKWNAARRLGVTAAVYRLNRSNVAIADPSDPTRSLLVDAQRTRGLELEVSGSPTDALTLIAGYAWQDGRITRNISTAARAGAALAQVPEHSLSFWSKYAFSPRWAASLGVVHRSELFASTDNTVVLPRFTRVDAALFLDLSARLRAQVNVENLFDADYFASAHNNNNITPGAPRGVRFALTVR